MKNRLPAKCIDINSIYCPCILAETNHCVYCSHLKGEAVCNCNWAGVCILNEKGWQSTRAKNKWIWDENITRADIEVPITGLEYIAEHTYKMKILVPDQLAQSLDCPGSFIFLRRTEDPDFFKFPVGIMSVNSETIEVVIETIGPKSSRLLQDDPKHITVRGPYYNGIFGQPWVEKLANGNVVVITGGMGQPPAVPIVKKLAENGNRITAIIAPGKIGKIFVDDILRELGADVLTVSSMRREGMAKLREIITNKEFYTDLIASAGPDEQHHGIINVLQSEDRNIPMAATNNATMCCGEGICGSCDKETRSGKIIRTCKVQTDFLSFV